MSNVQMYDFQQKNEIWKPIKNYEGLYEVSNLGRVKSVDRVVIDSHCTRIMKGKILVPTKINGKQPYCYVSLSKDGKPRKTFVHRLVAKTFLDNPMKKEQVNHIDGNVLNNEVSNLEWCTNAENTQHAYDTWLNQNGQLHITYKGETHSLMKWCRELGLNYKRTHCRIKYLGWSIERAFKKEVMKNHVRNQAL